jgi:hypothetical protein
VTVVLSASRRTRDRYQWQVDTLTRAGGVAQLRRIEDGVRVLVADRAADGVADGAVARPPDSAPKEVTEAWLYGDGHVLVRSNTAPPALLVTTGGARLLPAAPEVECVTDTSDGDLLVLCSAEALGHLPNGLGGVLACSPLRLGAYEPEALLERLMAGTDVGAALLARCRITTPPRQGGES